MLGRLILCVFLLWHLTGLSQETDPVQQLLQETFELLEEDLDEQELVQWAAEFENLLQKPILINYATPEELLQIPFINVFHVHQIVTYRKKVKKIYTIYELVHTTTLTEREINLLQYLLSFSTERETLPEMKKALKYGKHQFITRFQRELTPRIGYSEARKSSGMSHYTGDPNRLLHKYEWGFANRIQFHLALEKDAGEPFGASHQPFGFDFSSIHFAINKIKKMETLIFGDYNLQFGQGLLLWNGMAPRYSADATQSWRFGRGIRPYRGVDENRFFRGLASKWQLSPHLSLQAFGSHNPIDATSDGQGFSNLRNTGLHRTPTEIAQRRNLQKSLAGLHFRYSVLKFDMGITHYNYRYSMPQLSSDQPHQIHNFTGQNGWATSLDYRYINKGFQLFGEWGWHNNKLGYVKGLQWKLNDKMAISGAQRNIPSGFQTPYTTVFGGNSSGNFRGTYIGLYIGVNRRSSLNAYVDWLQFPFWRFGVESPSSAERLFLQYDYERFKQYHFSIRYRYTTNQQMNNLELPLRELTGTIRHNLRLHLTLNQSSNWTLQTRWETNIDGENNFGSAAFQEFRYTRLQHKFIFRYTVFETPSFASAVYTFEPDLPLGFSVPALYGSGNRMLFLYSFKTKQFGEWGIRFAHLQFFDRVTIGSGLDETPGNSRLDLRVFSRFRF